MVWLINTKQKTHVHPHESAIKIDNITFGYTKKSNQLDGVSFEIHRKEWTTILGPNGSGKSTLAKLLVRINKFNQGLISLDNREIRNYSNKEYARKVAYIPQIIDIPEGISVYDFVSYGRNPWLGFASRMSKKDHEIVEGALVRINAFELKDKMMEELSGGQRQKVLVALAIAQTADIIILDEPTTYLDIKAQFEVLELMYELHNEGKTILTILHDINQATQYSDEIIVLKDGKVYDRGTPEKVVTEDMLREVYGVDSKLHKDGDKKYLTNIKLIK